MRAYGFRVPKENSSQHPARDVRWKCSGLGNINQLQVVIDYLYSSLRVLYLVEDLEPEPFVVELGGGGHLVHEQHHTAEPSRHPRENSFSWFLRRFDT